MRELVGPPRGGAPNGDAAIRPGQVQELAIIRMSGERYVAKLTVTTPDGRYERVLQSPEG